MKQSKMTQSIPSYLAQRQDSVRNNDFSNEGKMVMKTKQTVKIKQYETLMKQDSQDDSIGIQNSSPINTGTK